MYLNQRLNEKLGHEKISKEDCAHVMQSVKGKYGCSNTSGFFTFSLLGLEFYGNEWCFCAKDDCDSAKRNRNEYNSVLYSIYRMLGKFIFL